MPYFNIAGNTLVANLEAEKHFVPGTRKPRSVLAKMMVDIDPSLPFLMLPGMEYPLTTSMQNQLIYQDIPATNGERMNADAFKNLKSSTLVFRPNIALVTLYSCMTQLADMQGSKTSDTSTTKGMVAISLCNWQLREIMLATKGDTQSSDSLMKIIDDETGAPTKVDAKDVIVEKRKSMRTDQTNEEIFGTSEYMIEPEAYKLKSIPEIELTYQLMPFLSTEDKQYSEPFDELRRSTEEEKKGIRAMMLEILNKAGPSFARAARSLNVVLPGATVSTKTRGRITMDPNNSIKSFDKAYKMWEDAVPETQGNIDSKYAWRGIFELALFLTYPSPVMVSDIKTEEACAVRPTISEATQIIGEAQKVTQAMRGMSLADISTVIGNKKLIGDDARAIVSKLLDSVMGNGKLFKHMGKDVEKGKDVAEFPREKMARVFIRFCECFVEHTYSFD